MMLNVYESVIPQTNNNNQPFLCADDFINRISAFDETFNQTFGIASKRNISATQDLNSHRIFVTVEDSNLHEKPIKRKTKLRSKTFEGRLEPKRNSVNNENTRTQGEELDFNEFVLRMPSDSVPFALGSENPDYVSKNGLRRRRIRSLQLGSDSSRKQSNFNSVFTEEKENHKEQLLNIELHEEDAECDAIAVGLPNLRSLSVIPTEPRPVRAKHYFSRLKNGLTECVEVELNRLQEAELNQDVSVVNEVSKFLNRIQQRLQTIAQLEEEYNQHWKAYKKIQFENSQQGLVCRKESNLGHVREFSKSTLGLTSTTTTARESDIPETVTSLASHDSSSLAKPPWFSSMMNILRTKSRKKLSSPLDSANVSPKSDDRFSWNKSLSGELCVSEFRQKLFTPPKRRKSRISLRNPKQSRDSLTLATQKQEEYLKQQLCQIEAQVEYLSGTIKCEVVGISGPNHYLNKDEFKVSLKQGLPILHSLYELDGVTARLIPLHRSTFTLVPSGTVEQKWNLHGRVHSGSKMRHRRKGCTPFDLCGVKKYAFPKQIWDHPGHVFSPVIDGLFTLKVTELKRFGKDEVLLHQAFDFSGLFTSKTYHLSTPLRNHGQVRFNLLLRWCPLADTDDQGLVYYTSPSLQLFNSSSKRRSKTNGIRFYVNDVETNLSSSKLDLFHTVSTCDPARSGQSPRNSQATDLTRSRSTPSSDNMSRCTSLSACRLERQPSGNSVRRHSKVTIIHADKEQVNCSPKTNEASSLKIWMSMPNLAGSATRKSTTSSSNFTPSPNTQLIKDDLKQQSSKSSSISSDLDILIQPIQSISVRESSRLDRPVQVTRTSNHSNDCGLRNKVNLLRNKLSQSQNLPSICSEVLSHLEKLLAEFEERLNKIRPKSSDVHFLSECNGSVGRQVKSTGEMKNNLGKQDTLSSLWESFDFLQEPFDTLDPCARRNNLRLTAKRPEREHPENSKIPDRNLSTGWKQLDLAVVWHLDYIQRLLDQISQRQNSVHSLETLGVSDFKAPSLLPSGNKEPINVITTSIHTYWMTLSLIGQINALKRILELVRRFADRPQTTPLEYVASIIGGHEGVHMHSYRQCIYPLVWPNGLEESDADLSCEPDGPLLMLDVRSLQHTLYEYYNQTVAPDWPEVKVSTVVEAFLGDLLDVDVNGENVFTVPITHLEQRLRLSEPSHCKSSFNRLPDDRFHCAFTLQLNDQLKSVLMYLAGQCYIQEKLQDPTASNMLSTLPYFERSYQALFDLPSKLHCSSNRTASSSAPEPSVSMRVVASQSTRTWLAVSSLISNKNKEISYKAISLLLSADRILLEFSESLRLNPKATSQNGTLFSYLSGHLPILYTHGPPLHCHLSLVDLFSHNTKPSELLPPLWASLVWCIEDSPKSTHLRMAGLHGLAVLFQQQHYQLQMKAKQLFQLGLKSEMVMNNVISVNAITNLMAYLAAFDKEPQVRRFAKRVVQKLETQTRIIVASPKTISGNRPIQVIWSSPKIAQNR